jgi:SAM-dependent methyltransferase
MVEVVRRARTVSAKDYLREADGLDAMFLEQLQREDYRHRTAIDVGTGSGRVVWVVAPRAHRVVAVDNDEKRLMEARAYAAVRGFNRVVFVLGDAEKEAWSAFQSEPFDFVFAHLFMSEPVVYRASHHTRAGGKIILCALHPDHWKETGRESRHSFGDGEIRDLLGENGFELEFLGVNRTAIECADLQEAERVLGPPVVRKWVEDGRWEGLADSFRRGVRTITHAYVVAKARKLAHGTAEE